jgi:hypothetical protein
MGMWTGEVFSDRKHYWSVGLVANPGLCVNHLRAWWQALACVSITLGTVWCALHRCYLPRLKQRFLPCESG